MDLQTGLLSAGVCLISAVVVYLISVFGMREKTYEEAIEEQRKRNQEAAQHSKVEKPKKERKFKKQSKRSKESRNSEEELEQATSGNASNHANDHVDFKTETEIIPQEPDIESKPPKAKKKFKAAPKSILLNKQDVGPVSTEIPTHEEDADNDVSDSPPAFVPMDELERRRSLDIGQKKLALLIQNSQATVPPPALPEVKAVQEEVKEKPEVKLEKKPLEEAPKKSKKQQRSESFENVEGELSFKKLLSAVKKLTLVDDEIQTLIDILLNKQQEGSEWTKKNDPVALLKKQLNERESSLEAEQRLAQAANAKLKEIRQELTQERTRSANVERALRQELQTVHARLQAAADVQVKNQQVHAKTGEEQALTVVRLSEEKASLQQQVQLLEVERQKWAAHERDLQRELEDRYQSGLVQEQERMSLQLQSKDAQLQQLLSAQQEGDFQCTQVIAELKQQLQELKGQGASLGQELEGERAAARQRLDEKEMLLRKQEEDLQRIKRMAEEERLKLQGRVEQLQGQVKNATNQLQDFDCQMSQLREEGEALRQQLASEQQEKHSLQGSQAAHLQQERVQVAARLSENEDALRQSQSELSEAHRELDSQKAKNNELRERNWKAMDALGALEKSSKEKEEALARDVAQARQEAQALLQKQQQQQQQQQQSEIPQVPQDQIQRLQEEERCYLQRILTDSQVDPSLEHSTWLEQFSERVREQLGSAVSLRSENASLAAQIHHYQTVLSDTESMLKKLQSGVEAQEGKWAERLAAQQTQTQQVLEEKRTLEAQLQQLQGIEEATAEMQGRLKELQAKLQGEESDRKGLEVKTEEALARCSALNADLESRTQEMEHQRKEGVETLTSIQLQLDTVQKDLEKERKITKELGSQAVKLNSLVKIGQDALRAEQELVKHLQAQVTTAPNNGNNNNNNNNNNNKIPAANGTAVENESAVAVGVRTDKPNKSKKRGASGKK